MEIKYNDYQKYAGHKLRFTNLIDYREFLGILIELAEEEFVISQEGKVQKPWKVRNLNDNCHELLYPDNQWKIEFIE